MTVDDNVDNLKRGAPRSLTVCSDQKIETMLIDFGTFVVIERKSVWLYPG